MFSPTHHPSRTLRANSSVHLVPSGTTASPSFLISSQSMASYEDSVRMQMAWWERSPVMWFEEKDMRRDEKSMTVLKVNGIGGEDDFSCGCRRNGTSTLASWYPLSLVGQSGPVGVEERKGSD